MYQTPPSALPAHSPLYAGIAWVAASYIATLAGLIGFGFLRLPIGIVGVSPGPDLLIATAQWLVLRRLFQHVALFPTTNDYMLWSLCRASWPGWHLVCPSISCRHGGWRASSANARPRRRSSIRI